MGEQHEHEHEHQHSDACCHGDSHSEHHTASNGKSSNSRQATELESDQESGSEEGEGNEEEEEEDDEEEEEGQADLVFPATYSLALVQLLSAESAAVNVKDIKLDGDETKLDLAVTLWREGIVAVQPQPSKKSEKKSKK